MFWLFVVALWAAMLLAPVLLLFIFLPSGSACPRCGKETLPIRSRLLHPARRLASLRWCMECSWQGVMRQTGVRKSPRRKAAIPDTGHESDNDAPWRSGPLF